MVAPSRRKSGKGIRETLGTLGLIASLVFVGLEIRQNNVALRASAIQESINVARQQTQMLATNPDLIRIGLALAQGEPVTEVEAAQNRWVASSFWWGMQGVYRQWQLGVLPDEEWAAWDRVICNNIERPGGRTLWEGGLRDTYIPGFVAEVESCFNAEAS